MLFDRIGQDRLVDGRGAVRRRRNLAAEDRVEPQCRRVAAGAAALGGMTGVTVPGRRRFWIRSGLFWRNTIVLATRIANWSGVRKTARHQLPKEQQDCEAESWATTYHAGILNPTAGRS